MRCCYPRHFCRTLLIVCCAYQTRPLTSECPPIGARGWHFIKGLQDLKPRRPKGGERISRDHDAVRLETCNSGGSMPKSCSAMPFLTDRDVTEHETAAAARSVWRIITPPHF
ncbi:hypothetical protein, unlikely [Trypanosoma brucei gambiense DAL972]|uniref:T. brucei spp.-specific protein n=1 Tax=Trypanosoma brucei gambiense (strain MHOM/CI/86/DAL972) TaxID=679716 RepID=C9ZUQ7_TRYB9|nr:hypothetical protein, unlikely [Trypanosoma brucei gambiense DAL972]CBH13145.1 hypothetical protein, unlikely [Trypanosoma brucei gambiense DAL972]|eukprot:XP_011775422.1 hypothetical protein, unlikely [Trypanosoma brucei gambiense DAL972]